MTALTDEHYRILRAASERALVTNPGGRWIVMCGHRPDRKSRERLKARGLIDYGTGANGRIDYGSLVLTDKGRQAMLAAESTP